VRLTGFKVGRLAQYLIVFHHHASDPGIGSGAVITLLCYLQRKGHVGVVSDRKHGAKLA
jgi:hypothetical protein